jgi:hypothetical protein
VWVLWVWWFGDDVLNEDWIAIVGLVEFSFAVPTKLEDFINIHS